MNNSISFTNRNVPAPPSLHWAIVLVLSIVTLGLFGFIWMLRQAWFARKLNPGNWAFRAFTLAFALFLFSALGQVVVAITVARGGEATDMGTTGWVIFMFQTLAMIAGYLEIRETLAACYSVRLNLILTVVFNVYYVQYHLSRIAKLNRARQSSEGMPPLASPA